MTVGRVLISWMAASLWFAGGLLFLTCGYFFVPPYVPAGLASLAIALFVAAVPVKPVSLVSAVLALAFAASAVFLTVIEPTPLAGLACLAYASAAFFSLGAYRYKPQRHADEPPAPSSL